MIESASGSFDPDGHRRTGPGDAFCLARFPARLVRSSAFEQVERRSGFLESLCILEQSHEAQAHTGGLEAVAHLVGKLVVCCEHGSVSFRGCEQRIEYVALTVGWMPHP